MSELGRERHWVCTECGAQHDRNENAALNLMRISATGGWPGSYATGRIRL